MRMITWVVCALCGCADESVIEVGQLEIEGAGRHVVVPMDAMVNELLLIEIMTWGDGCYSFERTDVELIGDSIDVTPYDRRRLGDGVCPNILRHLDHSVTVKFETPGAKTVRVTGRRVFPSVDEPLELTFPVMVN